MKEKLAEGDDTPPRIEGYDIFEVLGRGGMGIVYRAVHRESNRVVALKVIRRDRLTQADSVTRFRREARAASRLAHPNVVAIYNSDQEGDIHYLALEYVPGLTLQQMVEQGGALDVHLACDIIRQAALGLQHAADQSLVHRDIKPANLMVFTPTGGVPGRPLIKLLDMGVARIYGENHEDSLTTLTRDGVVIGTPDYIAPEQLESPHTADIRADLYSLGCTFYFLLSGQVPFPGGTLIQKLDKQRWHTAPSVDQIRPEVPRSVAAIVRRLMAKHPDDRYPTPAALAEDLEHLVETGELPASYQPRTVQPSTTCEGHEGPVTAGLFLPEGQVLSGGKDGTVRLWDASTGQEIRRVSKGPSEVGCLALARDRGLILIGQGVNVRVYDLSSGREVMRLAGHADAVRGVAATPDGRLALTAGSDRKMFLWNLETGKRIVRMTGFRSCIRGVAISIDGRWGVSGDEEPTLRLWDLNRGQEVRRFTVPRGAIQGVDLTLGGRTIASAHFDTTVRLWDASDGRENRRFTGHSRMVSSVAFSPDGERVASAGHDCIAMIWDILSGAELCSCKGHEGPVTHVSFSPNGKHLLTCSDDGTVKVWEMPG